MRDITEMSNSDWSVVKCFPEVTRVSHNLKELTSCVCVGVGEVKGTTRGTGQRQCRDTAQDLRKADVDLSFSGSPYMCS